MPDPSIPAISVERPLSGDVKDLAMRLVETHSGLEWAIDFFRPAQEAYTRGAEYDWDAHRNRFADSMSKSRSLYGRALDISEVDRGRLYDYCFKASLMLPDFSTAATWRVAALFEIRLQLWEFQRIYLFFEEAIRKGQSLVRDREAIMPEFQAVVLGLLAQFDVQNLDAGEVDWEELYVYSVKETNHRRDAQKMRAYKGLPFCFRWLDHLVYATPDLDRSVRVVGDLLGVMPSVGGQHPAWGTRNALLALGPTMYLEIVGPDFDNPPPARARPFNIDGLEGPRLATWACRQSQYVPLEAQIEGARHENKGSYGVDLGNVQAGSRRLPDGLTLSWRMTDPMMPREGGIVPFFIDWGDSDHPAERAPTGCSLRGLRAEHPDHERVGMILGLNGLGDLKVEPGLHARLIATIACPRGKVELS